MVDKGELRASIEAVCPGSAAKLFMAKGAWSRYKGWQFVEQDGLPSAGRAGNPTRVERKDETIDWIPR